MKIKNIINNNYEQDFNIVSEDLQIHMKLVEAIKSFYKRYWSTYIY